jgi:hypothetical protein
MTEHSAALQLAVQVMMGVSLAACAGLRAWLPLFGVGLLGRLGLLALNPSFAFLQSTPALTVFAVATLLELLGDKVVAVDHFLDAAGTFIRPMAGTLLVASTLTKSDPTAALVAGIIVGGGTALTVHAGKAVVRAKSTALSVFHGGLGNALLSLLEDGVSFVGTALAFLLPVLAFVLALGMVALSVLLVVLFWKAGRKLWRVFFSAGSEGAAVP